MQQQELKEFVENFNQNSFVLYNNIINFRCIMIYQKKDLDKKTIQKIDQQNLITIAIYIACSEKYLIIGFENFIIFCLSSNIASFFHFLKINSNTKIISISHSATELFNQYINQNTNFNIIYYEDVPYLKEEVVSFKRFFVYKFSNTEHDVLFELILTNIYIYLIKKAYLQINLSNRVKKYYENVNEHKLTSLSKDDYIDLRIISVGSSSYVKLIYHIQNRKLYALKILNKSKQDLLEREKSNYATIKHPFLCILYGTANVESSECLILEYINGFSLVDEKEVKKLSIDEKLKIVFEMFISINYLHKKFVVRDVNPINFLIDHNNTLALIDFNRMYKADECMIDSIDGTYLAPESSNRREFSTKSDIFSLGKVIQFFMENELKADRFKKFNDIIKQCTQEDPNKRPTIAQLINDFYINVFSQISGYISEIDSFKLIKDISDEKYQNYLIFLAESSNQYSLNELAKIYEKGDIFPRNIHKAIKYYSLSVSQGNEEAKENIQKVLEEIKANNSKSFGNIYNDLNEDQFSNDSMIDRIHNKDIRELYKKFNFIYYPPKVDILSFLKDIKFLVYDYSQTNSKVIICFEDNCIILDIDVEQMSKILSQINASIINININENNNKLNQTQNDLFAIKEADEFCKNFKDEINTNQLVSLTIRAISAFIIRRYFYPSSFFKDSSFFSFNHCIQSFEHENKERLYKLFDYENELDFKSDLRQFIHTIYNKKIHDLQSDLKIQENNDLNNFKLSDFIELRSLYSDDNSTYKLALHIKCFYVFMIKIIENENDHKDEINFCSNYSHQCLNQFFGFIKNENEIIGFVYQYMTNGSLKNYLLNNSNEINKVFTTITIVRILEIIYYFETKSIKNHKIKLSNIFLDHDNIPFIMCTSLVENDENNSFIEYLASIIYFLYEKKELKRQNEKMPSITNCSKNIQIIFDLCFDYNLNIELVLNKQLSAIFNELSYSNFIDNYLLSKTKMNKNEIINISYEMINYIACVAQPNQLSLLMLSFFFNIYSIYLYINGKIDELYYQRGFIYANSYGVECNYEESKRCYEISASYENPKAILQLGILYENGYGVKKDYKKALDYYEESAKYEYEYAFYQLGYLYAKGLGVNKDNAKAKDYFIKSCQNDQKNYFHIGLSYEKGNDFDRNYNIAKEFYELAAKNNDSDAITRLGIMYMKGIGVKKNYYKAKQYFEEASELDNSDASYYLGNLYEKGYGVIKNEDLAVKYYIASAKSKNSSSLLRLVKLLYKKNPNQAKEYYRKFACIKSDVLLNIGIFYENGQGVKQDYSKAKEMYEFAKILNNPDAYLYLGYLYEYGNGVNANHQEAQHYFYQYFKLNEKANYLSKLIYTRPKNANQYYKNFSDYITEVFQNKSSDIYHLAYFFQTGFGVNKNVNLAILLYKYSAQFNNSKALVRLGNIYEEGFIETKDILRAESYYKKASNLGDSIALCCLGHIYENTNPQKAMYYYKLSSDFKNPKALLQLGKMYLKGDKKDYSKAKEYFESSSKLGNSESFLLLGNLYYKGKGVQQSYKQAIFYYKKSSELGNSIASVKLGTIYSIGKGDEVNKLISIDYYLKCIEEEQNNKLHTPYYYNACNDLGLIYLIEYNCIDLGEKYLKESGLHEYPIGQNSYGVFLLFYENNAKKAEQMFEKCAKQNNILIPEFILGYLLEKDNKIEESINYFKKITNAKISPIMYRSEKIIDEPFQISQRFIICCADIKLIPYYLLEKNYQKACQLFTETISNIKVLLHQKDFKSNFSIFKQFFMNLFSYTHNYNDIQIKDNFLKVNQKCLNYPKKQSTYFIYNEYKNDDELFQSILNNPCFFFNLLVCEKNNVSNFIEEINKIIDKLYKILFSPPYSIIFGRINFKNTTFSNKPQTHNISRCIDDSFREGFKP